MRSKYNLLGTKEPLHVAAYRDDCKTIKTLLKEGADVNAKVSINMTPLHYAAWGNAVEATVLLLKEGAEINAQNCRRWTPLHQAADRDSFDVVRKLLSHSTVDLELLDDKGETALTATEKRWQTSKMRQHETEQIIAFIKVLKKDRDFIAEMESQTEPR